MGLENEAEILKGYLFEESLQLDVISVVGQGGLGKTTLAGKIFRDPDIFFEFPTRIWVSVSKELCAKNVFLSILKEFTTLSEVFYHKSDQELANLVSEYLVDARFLLVIDGLWTSVDWDRIRCALPSNSRMGKVLITTCQVEVSRYVNHLRDPHKLRYLTFEESWLLLRLEVFGKPEFPLELEAEGKLMADQCQGLPLAIVLLGGILVRKHLVPTEISTVRAALTEASDCFNADLDVNSAVVLYSYEKLAHQLRKCFLYVGMFPGNYEIPTRKLINMWIAEGFIQEEDNICVEETAEKYLDVLISSNLLRAGRLNADGKVKTCIVHDLVRDICFRKAVEDTDIFFQEICMSRSGGFIPPVSEEHEHKRICIHSNVLNFLSGKPYCPTVHSFVCFSTENFDSQPEHTAAIARGFKQLRVLDVMPLQFTVLPSDMYELLHLRYLALSISSAILPAAFSKFQNMQTLVVHTTSRKLDIKAGILNMTELRHFKTNASATLPKPDTSSKGGGNIQALETISPESCTEEVLDSARNLKKLGIRGKLTLLLEGKTVSFNSFGKLENLEKMRLINDVYPKVSSDHPLHSLPPADTFPIKLRSLTLSQTYLDWRYMSILGSLENLEVLKLKDNAFHGKLWEASAGGFPHLQVLHIGSTDLVLWVASSHHDFPKLKRLELHNCEDLLQVPIELARVPSFQHLDLFHCRRAVGSAKNIEALKRGAYPFHLSTFPPLAD